MEVAGILAGLGGLRGLAGLIGRGFQATSDTAAAANSAATKPDATDGQDETVQEILSDVDLREITPRELSHLAHQLFSAGAITASEYQALASIRAELEAADVPPDRQVDVIDILAGKLEKLQSSSAQNAGVDDPGQSHAGQTRRQLDLLTRLEALDSAATAGHRQSVNAVV